MNISCSEPCRLQQSCSVAGTGLTKPSCGKQAHVQYWTNLYVASYKTEQA
jgi:hypothetical protein